MNLRASAIATFVLMIFSFNMSYAESELPPEQQAGTYAFRGEINPHSAIWRKQIRQTGDEGTKRRDELVREGYECRTFPSRAISCIKHVKRLAWPQELAQREAALQAEIGPLTLGAARGTAEVISAGEALKIWSIPQAVEFAGFHGTSFELLTSPMMVKLRLGDPAGANYRELIYDPSEKTYGLLVSATARIREAADEITEETTIEYSGLAIRR